MSGIDLLLSRDLSIEIKKWLEDDIITKIEKDLFFQHGMSIKLSVEHFEKLQSILKNHIEFDINEFRDECLKKVIQIINSKRDFVIKIISPRLSELIFDYFGDSESRKILIAIMNEPLTVPEILNKSGVLKSPAYRKIENLLLDGIILESGKILTNSKRVSQYRCIFDQVSLIIENGEYSIQAIVNNKYFKQSSLYKSGLLENHY